MPMSAGTSSYMARRDPKTYYLDENEYHYVDEHDAFFHRTTKFWYVIDHKLFWSSQENKWYSYDNATQVWQNAAPPKRMNPGPWNPNKPKPIASKPISNWNNRTQHRQPSSTVPQLGRNLGETHKVVDVATLLFDLKPQLAQFTDKKEKLAFLVKRIREQFKVDDAEAKRLYQEARKQFKSSNQSQLQRVVQQTQQHQPTLVNTRIAQPIVPQRVPMNPVLVPQPMMTPFGVRPAPYVAPVPIVQPFRQAVPVIQAPRLDGTWSDKTGDQFWHITESNGMFVGVGTWNGYEHWDCILRGFKKPDGEITMAINYSFRKKDENWAANHIAYWKGKQKGDKLMLESKQSQQKLELTRKHTAEPTKLKQRKVQVMNEMKQLLDTVTSTAVGQQKLNDAVTMLRLLHIPSDSWVQQKWSLRAQQAYQKAEKGKSKRGDDLSDPAKKKADNQAINRQHEKKIIEINGAMKGYACMVCAIRFKDPGGLLRLCHHILHDPTHAKLVEPFLHENESISQIPSLLKDFGKRCKLCKKNVSISEVFGHVHSEMHLRAVAKYCPPAPPKSKSSHTSTKKRKASHSRDLPSAKRRSKAKPINKTVERDVVKELMLVIRENWCKTSSRLKYWSGVKIKSCLSQLKEEFSELKTWDVDDLERLVNTVNRLSVSSDGSKIQYNNHMGRGEYFQEMVVARMWRRYSDECRTKQEKLEWRGVDTKTLYRDKDVKDAAKDLNLRKEDRFKQFIYENGKNMLGIHFERDTDQKAVKDFTIWVRFEETRRTTNYKKKHLQSEMEHIKKKVRPAKQCRQEFKKGIEDSMISKDRITLKDTFTLRRIQVPAKAKNCEHTQCFDLESYLKMKLFQRDVYKMKKGSSGERVKVERWKCPVCNKTAKRGDLYVDGFWQEILNDPATKDYDSVFVMPDCTYQVEELDQGEASDSEDEEINHAASTKKPAAADAVISLLSDDEDDAAPPPPAKAKPTSPAKKSLEKAATSKPPKDTSSKEASAERRKQSTETSRSRSRRTDRRRRSRSPERYSKQKAAPSRVESYTKCVMDKSTDYEFLVKILDNINLGDYKEALVSKKLGLSDLMDSISRNDMKDITSVITDRSHLMLLVQHVFCLIEDPEALMVCIGKANSPLAGIFIGKK